MCGAIGDEETETLRKRFRKAKAKHIIEGHTFHFILLPGCAPQRILQTFRNFILRYFSFVART